MDLSLLLVIVLLVVIWYWKRYYLTLALIVFFPVLIFLLILGIGTIPPVMLSPSVRTAVALGSVGIIIFLLRMRNKEKDLPLICGVIILGIGQVFPLVFSGEWLSLILVSDTLAYLLFYLYTLRNSRDLCLDRTKKAEAKIANLNKTINLEVRKRVFELERHNEHLLKMIQKDPLVDAYNKKGILNLLKEMIEEPGAQRFTIILFDLDNFKIINDTQGHLAGDAILRKVAKIARASIRGFDYLGRFGGDEFLIILPGTNVSDALFVAERFRRSITEESAISVSIGVAAFPEDGRKVQEILEAADAGLYESKRKGKNSVTYYKENLRNQLLK
jgi:diguanylate cyclase (GGDEF)-like protein